jgi:hypothetical protein
MREALKRDAAQRRAATARARLIDKAEASGYSSAPGVNPLERAALVKRLHKPEMTDDGVDEIVRVVEAYLSGRLCAADWRLWLRHRQQAKRAAVSGRRGAAQPAQSACWPTSRLPHRGGYYFSGEEGRVAARRL